MEQRLRAARRAYASDSDESCSNESPDGAGARQGSESIDTRAGVCGDTQFEAVSVVSSEGVMNSMMYDALHVRVCIAAPYP